MNKISTKSSVYANLLLFLLNVNLGKLNDV